MVSTMIRQAATCLSRQTYVSVVFRKNDSPRGGSQMYLWYPCQHSFKNFPRNQPSRGKKNYENDRTGSAAIVHSRLFVKSPRFFKWVRVWSLVNLDRRKF